ncbi:4006_t:CDS:2 [Entrophospora sp. SA101]|nr:4006_t:CDS:2 [Entrophospora sp. SA101]CAJ0883634.1 12221_t:CDS:2 [Entrophospora sp. SA101]
MSKYSPLNTSEEEPTNISSTDTSIKKTHVHHNKNSGCKTTYWIIALSFVVSVAILSTFPPWFYLNNQQPTTPIQTDITDITSPPPSQESTTTTGHGRVIATYFPSWSIYGRKFFIQDLDFDKITHILYAFANFKSDGDVFLGDSWSDTDIHFEDDSWNDNEKNLYGNFKQLYLLKKKNRHLKVSLSIGGWTWSTNFPAVASSHKSRERFVDTAIKLMNDLGLDGLDIDWEYPGNEDDANNYVKLLKDLREALDQYAESKNEAQRYLLTAAVPCGENVYKIMKLREMEKYLDIFYLMAYDFQGSWSSVTGHQSNLYGEEISINKAVLYYLGQGIPGHKIVIGMPVYGRAFQETNGLGSSFNGVGEGTWEAGIYDYKKLPKEDAIEYFDDKSIASFSYSSSQRELVTYDTPKVVTYKTEYIRDKCLRGVMFWELSSDYPTSDDRSLLLASFNGLGGKDELDKNLNHLSYPKSIYENVRKLNCED